MSPFKYQHVFALGSEEEIDKNKMILAFDYTSYSSPAPLSLWYYVQMYRLIFLFCFHICWIKCFGNKDGTRKDRKIPKIGNEVYKGIQTP